MTNDEYERLKELSHDGVALCVYVKGKQIAMDYNDIPQFKALCKKIEEVLETQKKIVENEKILYNNQMAIAKAMNCINATQTLIEFNLTKKGEC